MPRLWILTKDGRVVSGLYTAAEALSRAASLRDAPASWGFLDWGEGEIPPRVEERAAEMRRRIEGGRP